MNTKKFIPIIFIVIASLACSLFQGTIPEAQAAGDSPASEASEASATSATSAESAPETEPALQSVRDESQIAFDEALPDDLPYPIVDTGQVYCYDDSGGSQPCPTAGETFYGQDAQYSGYAPSYSDNGDGTISDNITGLMWQQDPGEKISYAQAVTGADNFTLAGYDDWRLPTIKELYSLILFSGYDVSGWNSGDTSGLTPFIDAVFAFEYGDTTNGERIIDSQWATNSKYFSTTMNGTETIFGVNFADGRIKGYGTQDMRGNGEKTFFVIYVRGNPDYGINDFTDNGNGTISDNTTGLTWMQNDSGNGLDWEGAINYCESLDYAGSSDWRLPNVKELQSILDYSRSPDATNSAAIDPLFNVTSITNEAGQVDYPFYWSSTTHANMKNGSGGAYVAFGRGLGYMNNQWIDVHGAGTQRSDPKSGDPADWPTGHGPQGDAIRINNYARCVTGGVSSEVATGGAADPQIGAGAAFPGGNGAQNSQGQQAQGPGLGSPPQEAIDACSGLSAGAACSFSVPAVGTISGTCTQVQTELACVPEGGPPQSGGGQQP